MTLPNEPLKEPVWKLRGYELRPSEFTTAWFITTGLKFSAAILGATAWMPPRTGQ